ncbi:MAG: glycosyltransferase family 2 protein [Chitinophagaceae bacterium]|nr:glycosyltransferase family 2 protein [Chitinophagaceae bacterium]
MEDKEVKYQISVIISNFNGSKYLRKLLDTLKEQVNVQLQIIIVDRNSTDNSLSIIKEYPEVKVVFLAPEHGLVAGYHHGYKEALYDLLFFCNEDMWFDPSCMYECAKMIDLQKSIAASDPWQWTYDTIHLLHAGVRFKRSFTAYNLSQPIPFIEEDTEVILNHGQFVPIMSAGAGLIHRRAYEETGGWDTSFFLDAEEQDFFLRFWKIGWRAVTVPSAKVYHALSVSNNKIVKNTSVKERRYVSNFSNKSIIAIKYFPVWYIFLNIMARLLIIIVNLFKLRFKLVIYQLRSLRLTFKRLRPAITYRKKFLANDMPSSLDYYNEFMAF